MKTETKKAQYTPGPWNAIRTKNGVPSKWCVEVGAGTLYVDTEANAALIAAAPDLLEADQMALGYMRSLVKRVRSPEIEIMLQACICKLESAIDRAEGR